MQVGKIRGLRPAWIDGDDHDLVGIGHLSPLDAFENYRMTVGRVGTDEEKAIRNVDICVASRRAVRAEGRLVTRRRRCHAQTGVGIEVIRAEKALRQLVADVILLGRELPGAVKGHCIPPVFADNVTKPLRQKIDRSVPRDPGEGPILASAHLRIE